MGKKRGDHVPDAVGAARAGNQAVSIREENSGKTRADAASLLRLQHLQRLAAWACGEAGVAPVSALLGRRLAGEAEAGRDTSRCLYLRMPKVRVTAYYTQD
ncbi:hypothetical protein GUJ93_ZPchr0001g31547 [Zizania palustris]|uniref:Uncharacterized protein n=1 Tax=Zizania palustris TaxID=103762 RepID=A0A8J5R5D5_ZIZPA|nr:hypothetical protein GUJ93_ZPchr0001g31547 [Zizania palustris]